MPDAGGDRLAAFRAAPARAAICTDFDGTLSAIVDTPGSARPVRGAVEVLDRLAAVYGAVAVVSGRPVSFLVSLLPSSVRLAGLYGLEWAGTAAADPVAESWRPVVERVAAEAEDSAPAGADVERKGLSLTLHFRRAPELGPLVQAWAEAAASRSGLSMRPARMSVELHPPVAVDKGTAVEAIAAGLDAVLFVGDDAGDLPAFDALDRLAQAGVLTLRVAVRSVEAPAELLARADLTVDDPRGVVAFLGSLLPS